MRAFQSRFVSLLEERRNRHNSSQRRRRDSFQRFRSSFSRTRSAKPDDNEAGVSGDLDLRNRAVSMDLRNRDSHAPTENGTTDLAPPSEKNEASDRRPSQDVSTIRWADEPNGRGRTRTIRLIPMAGVGARPDSAHPKHAVPIPEDQRASSTEGHHRGPLHSHFSTGFVSRNSQFFGLSLADREKLGGVEYRAVVFLAIIVPLYFFLCNFLGFLGVGAWITANRPEIATDNRVGPFWAGGFFAVSAFGNNGMSLIDANTTALQTRYVFIGVKISGKVFYQSANIV